jgi:hypothetical protein
MINIIMFKVGLLIRSKRNRFSKKEEWAWRNQTIFKICNTQSHLIGKIKHNSEKPTKFLKVDYPPQAKKGLPRRPITRKTDDWQLIIGGI